MDEQGESPPLELASIDQIVAELKRRYKSGVVVTEEQSETVSGESSPVFLTFFGGQITAMGLVRYADKELFSMMTETEED